jgi:hypothetical protein
MDLRRVVLLVAILLGASGCSREKPPGKPPASGQTSGSRAQQAHHPLPPEPLAQSRIRPEIRGQSGEIRNVFVSDRNLTKFSHPHHIYAAKASPDGAFLMVWHMDYPPRKVSVYRIQDGRKISTFEPGAGGHIRWAAHGLLYHVLGAGTDITLWRVYNKQGRELWRGSACGALLDASGRYVLRYPTLPIADEPIALADIRDATVLAEARPEDICSFRTHRWLDGKTLRVWYIDLEYQVQSIDLSLCGDLPEAKAEP